MFGRITDEARSAAAALFQFVTSADYRSRVAVPWMGRTIRDQGRRLSVEAGETAELLATLAKYARRERVSPKERDRALAQLADIARVVPALGIFLLPGGAILLPLLARSLPWKLLPSAYAKPEAEEGPRRGPVPGGSGQ